MVKLVLISQCKPIIAIISTIVHHGQTQLENVANEGPTFQNVGDTNHRGPKKEY